MGKRRNKLEINVLKVHSGLFHKDADILNESGRVIARPLDPETYISFCNYRWHRGIIKNKDICEKRKCKHYRKLYIKP